MRTWIQTTAILLFIGVFALSATPHAEARTWSGQVVDATTGRPVSGARVRAGSHGFPEVRGLTATTGADGQFRLTWDEDEWRRRNGDAINHYLRVDLPDPQRRFHHWSATLVRTAPSQNVVVRVIPTNVHIKGRVLSAEDGAPLRNTLVQLAISSEGPNTPLRATAHTVRTNDRGEFAFNPWRAFPQSEGGYSPIVDVAAGVSPRSDGEDFGRFRRQPTPMYQFGVEKDSVFYPIPSERVAPGFDDTVHTFVVIRHPAADKPPHAQPVTAELRGAPGAPPAAPAPPTAPPTAPPSPTVPAPAPRPADPVRVPGFSVEAGKRNVPQGGAVTVPVSLNHVDALANMNVNIHYDPAVVRPARDAARGNIISQALFEANVRDRGVVRLGFAQRDDIRGSGTLAQIPFEAVGRAGTRSPLRVEVIMASASAGGRVTPAQLIHGEIVIVNPEGRVPGDTTGTGDLTALDAMNALKMSVRLLPEDMVADLDGDRRVTARDATLILQRVVGR
jgi:hypothetical protein